MRRRRKKKMMVILPYNCICKCELYSYISAKLLSVALERLYMPAIFVVCAQF